MPDTILRKCGGCSDVIEINRNNITNILYHKNKYYHSKCFCEIAEKRSKTKRSTAVEWQTALDNLWELESDTKKMLEAAWIKDDLNEWLLNHYNITTVPTRFWQIIADIGNGTYKGKRCKPITMDILLETWKWGQKKLDSISRNNKMSHKGPASDDARIMYDLSIIISKVPNYLSHKSKMKMLQAEEKKETAKTHINYDNVQQTKIENNSGIDDISSLLDDIF
jgi:uncharacterized protein YnzC (UPF0291/DUF896 family)